MLDFIVYGLPFTENSGGIMVLYELAKTLKALGCSVKLYSSEKNNNPIFNDFYDSEILPDDLGDTTVVIYPEIIEGNPLRAKRVIRWLLCKVGIHTNKDIIKSWSPSDIIYFYSPFTVELNYTSIPYMYVYYNDPLIHNDPNITRLNDLSCYTLRKAKKFARKMNTTIHFIHEPNSIRINRDFNHKMQQLYFSKYARFYCYDHYTGLILNAIKCGCIAIVPKMENVSEMDFLKSGAIGYVGTRVPGLAYGVDEIPWAESSKGDIHNYLDKLVANGIDSVKNMVAQFAFTKYEDMENTLAKIEKLL